MTTHHRLSDSALVKAQSGIFTLGEIWTAAGDDAVAGVVDAAPTTG